jgi:hypothetical protein
MRNVRLDRLLGREVHTANNRRLGRVEEFRAERRGEDWIVTEYIIGAAGLAERLGLGARLLLGMNHASGYVARWDQIDLSSPDRLRITCPVGDLRRD